MTNEELIMLYRQGDKEAREKLILKNLRLIKKIANGYSLEGRTDYEFDDLVQLGVIGMMIAIEKYDHSFGAKFSTYAFHWIRQGMSRSLEGYISCISLQTPINGEEDLTLEDTIEDPRDYIKEVEKQVSFIELAQVLKENLTELQYQIFILKAHGYSMKAIANKCSVTWQKVKSEFDKGRRRLFKPQIILLLKSWLDEQTTFYKSPDYSQSYGSRTNYTDSIVERAAMQRERFIEAMAGLKQNNISDDTL